MEWRTILDEVPSSEEIRKQMVKMKDLTLGKDGVRLIYILKAGLIMFEQIVELIQLMFNNPADKWEELLKIGLVIPLFKKCDRNDPNNYRGVRLLAMESRILARIAADRLRIWSKKMDLLDDNQAGRI